MEGNKVRIIHAGYDRTIPASNVIPYTEELEDTGSIGPGEEKNKEQHDTETKQTNNEEKTENTEDNSEKESMWVEKDK